MTYFHCSSTVSGDTHISSEILTIMEMRVYEAGLRLSAETMHLMAEAERQHLHDRSE